MGCLVTTVRVLIALAALAIGLLSVFDQSARQVATEGALADLGQAVAAGLAVLSPDGITDEYDGQMVFVRGEIEPPTVRDPLTNLALPGVRLARTVELEQWIEEIEYDRSSTTSGKRYVYKRVWRDDLIDSDGFDKPTLPNGERRANPKSKPFENEIFVEPKMSLGAWAVSSYAFGFGNGPGRVPEEALSSAADDGWRADGMYLYRRDDPTVRIVYEYSPFERGSYSLIAVPESGVLDLPDELASVPLIAPGDVEPRAIVEAAGLRVPGVNPVWMAYVFFGLMLLIRPIAKPFDGLNDFTYAPFAKRVAMTAGIAALITAAIALMLPN